VRVERRCPLITDTAWVRPPEAIPGLDHLGAQAPCELNPKGGAQVQRASGVP
jgi:hypothetical protein